MSPEIPPDSIYLEFSAGKTDGNPARWPTDRLDPTPNADNEVNFMRPVALDEQLSIKWRTIVGREVGKLMGHANYAKCVLKDFPQGYKFYHHNKGPIHDPRTDPYLYGSASGRYRSPPEFIPHAFWLMTDETLDCKKCGCKYCAPIKTQRQISDKLGLKKQEISASGSNVTRGKPHIRHVAQPRKPFTHNVINHNRIADLRSSRRFRVGELVWCALSPAIRGSLPEEVIEFWPGLVSETWLNSEVLPHAPGEQWRVVQSNDYKIKLLAVRHSCVLPDIAIIPYQAYGPPPSLIESLRKSGDPTELKDLEQLAQLIPVFSGVESVGGSQLRFSEASTMFALAIQTAARFVRMWTPSDEWTFHGETVSPSSGTQHMVSASTVSVTEARHQGLWWGAERIWVDELVRLQPGRSQVVPQGSQLIYRASPRADGRGVLMRINSIFADPKDAPRDAGRVCNVAGVLYEVAEATYEEAIQNPALPGASVSGRADSQTSSVAVTDGTSLPPQTSRTEHSPSATSQPALINLPNFPAYPLPEPPTGYKFRQITKPGYEIVLDVSLIAGRYYPGLLKHPLLQDALADVDMNHSRVTQLSALCGLLAGAINPMECIDWVGTRLAMIQLANSMAQNDLHRYWHASSATEEDLKDGDNMDASAHPSGVQDLVMRDSET